MSLASGTRLGPYEIVAAIGAGGMGEVYRARDTRLDRTVAIKVLPAQFSADPLFRDRFEREARAISSLSHAHICALFDVGRQDGTDYLVLEYLEGETLENRLANGMLPLEQALQFAGQIASALDTAHRQGIIHRDLKPANIMVTKSGIKVLDFGLAKTGVPGGSVGASVLPTTPPNLTAHGAILGTFQYMSPEQLEGAEATAQSDIFSFGAVLYEMVTGKRAFEGKSQASLIAAILDREPPPVSASQPLAPPPLDQIVSRCLAKDPADRWQSARDLAGQLQWTASSRTRSGVQTPIGPRRSTRERLAWAMLAIAGLLAVALAVPAALYFRQPAPQEQIRFLVNTPPIPPTPNNALVVSPDGRSIAYVAASGPNSVSLFVRRMGTEVPQLLAGTEGAANPFWSPDSRYLAFAAEGLLKKIDVSGGSPLTICDWPGGNRAGTWNSEGIIVFASNSVLNRVSAAGGRPTPISVIDASRGETYHTSPYFLPDGRHYLYTAWSGEESRRGIYLAALDSPDLKRLLPNVSSKAVYADGFLLYQREGTVFAHPFDAERLEFTGEPIRIVDSVGTDPNGAHAAFSAAHSGVLIYRTGAPGGQNLQLAWLDRSGKPIEQVAAAAPYRGLDVSPDGKRVAFHRHDTSGGGDVWIFEAGRNTVSRLTFNANQDNSGPIWSPDGMRVAFTSQRNGKWALYAKAADGSGKEELMFELSSPTVPVAWSPDSKFIVYWATGAGTATDLWVLPTTGDRKPVPFLTSPFAESLGQISPDGRWIAYQTNETGRTETYIRPFPDGTGRWQVSANGGTSPRWRRDGKELYFLEATRMMAADVQVTGSSVQLGAPHQLFESGYVNLQHSGGAYHPYAVSDDGQRFLIPRPQSADTIDSSAPPITVVLNWTAGLKQ